MSDTQADDDTPVQPALEIRAPSRGSRWTVALPDGRSELVNPDDGRDLRRAARSLQVREDLIRPALLNARARIMPPLAPAVTSAVEIMARPLDRDETASQVFAGMDAALAGSPYPMLSWDGTRRLAALDVDIDRAGGPGATFGETDLTEILYAPAPTPGWAWRTQSGGLRLIFEPCERYGLTAAERAGLHALLVPRASFDVRTQRVELLSRTRMPPPQNPVRRGSGEYGVSDLRGALMRTGGRDAVPADQVNAWLAERGMQIGGRYEHTLCPINPAPSTSRESVMVLDDGVRCYRCEAWRPWSSLIGDVSTARPEPDPIVQAAAALVHWPHARLMLKALRPRCDDNMLRPGYKALVRVMHDARWPEVQEDAAEVFNDSLAVVRGRGLWLHADTLTSHDAVGPRTLGALPAARSGVEIERYMTGAPLAGFVPIEPVAHVVDRPTWRDGSVLVPRPIAGVAPEERLTYAEARRRLREAMGEGLSERWLDVVDLLVVAGLRAQLQRAAPPIVLLTGLPGSGKGVAVECARGILGLGSAHLRFDSPRELAMSVGEGLVAGAGILWADEIGKVVDWWHHSTVLLQLTAEHTWRKLHTGTVVTPVRAAIVLAGSSLPRGLATMTEIGRRATVVRLPRVNGDVSGRWQAGVGRAFGNNRLEEIRTTPAGAAIAEAWIEAALVEATGPASLSSWPEHADAIGGERLGEDAEARELQEIVAALYDLWRNGPDSLFVPADRRGAGWMRCWQVGRDDQAADLLAEWVHEDDDPHARAGRLGRLETTSVDAAAGLPDGADVTVAVRVRGRRVSARFVSGRDPASMDRRNATLFPAPVT